MDQITSLLKTPWSGTEDLSVQFAFWAPLPPAFQSGYTPATHPKPNIPQHSGSTF